MINITYYHHTHISITDILAFCTIKHLTVTLHKHLFTVSSIHPFENCTYKSYKKGLNGDVMTGIYVNLH